jgi:hypothetical protein
VSPDPRAELHRRLAPGNQPLPAKAAETDAAHVAREGLSGKAGSNTSPLFALGATGASQGDSQDGKSSTPPDAAETAGTALQNVDLNAEEERIRAALAAAERGARYGVADTASSGETR